MKREREREAEREMKEDQRHCYTLDKHVNNI